MPGERYLREIPCPSNEETREACPYATREGCHLSEHHVFPKRTADTGLKRTFGNLAINKITSCRWIHDTLDQFPPPEYPPNEVMRRTVLEHGGFDG